MSSSDKAVNNDPAKTKSSLSELLKQQQNANSSSSVVGESPANNNTKTSITEKIIPSEGSNSVSEDESYTNLNNKFNGIHIGSTKNQSANNDMNSPFSQSFITTNNAHTVAFGSSVQQNDSLIANANNDNQARKTTTFHFHKKTILPYHLVFHILSQTISPLDSMLQPQKKLVALIKTRCPKRSTCLNTKLITIQATMDLWGLTQLPVPLLT